MSYLKCGQPENHIAFDTLKSHLWSVLKLNKLLTTFYRNILQMRQWSPWSCPSFINSGAEGICVPSVVTSISQLHFCKYHLVIICGNGSSVGKAQIFSSCKSTWRNLKKHDPSGEKCHSCGQGGSKFHSQRNGFSRSLRSKSPTVAPAPALYPLQSSDSFFWPVRSIARSDDPYLSIGGTALWKNQHKRLSCPFHLRFCSEGQRWFLLWV